MSITPAERERGCILTNEFNNVTEIVAQSGSITGTPTFNKGVVLDGTGDLVSYNNVVGKFDHTALSIVIRFIPDFVYNENVQRTLLDTTNGARYRIVKQNNAASNVLSVVLGGTTIADIPSATYAAYWNVGEENVLVITSVTTDTSVWLNGIQILTDDNTAWTPLNPTEMYIGAKYDSSGLFDGEFLEVKVFSVQLTDAEAEGISNKTTYNYINNTRGDYPLNFANHDPTNNRILDVSGNGYHMDFGTGAVGTFPNKNTSIPGYDFDGGDFFVISSGLGITDYPFTMSVMLRTTSPGIVCAMDLADSSSGSKNCSIRIDTSNYIQASMRSGGGFSAAGSTIGNNGNWIHAVAVFASTTSKKLYLNGVLEGTNTTSVAFFTPDRFTIGRFGDLTPGANMVGDMTRARVWAVELTPLQIKDLYLRDLKDFTEV